MFGVRKTCRDLANILREIQQENDRLKVENAKLRKLCVDLYAEMLTYSTAPNYNASVWAVKLRELGVKVGRWTHDGIKYDDSAPSAGRARGGAPRL